MPHTMLYGYKNIQVTIQPNIGLDATTRQSVVDILNLLLADEAVLILKTRRADGYGGEIDVPELRPLYESQYTQLEAITNEVGERIQILGGSYLRVSEDLIDTARLRSGLDTVPGIMILLADHEALIRFLREDVQKCSEMYEDHGTSALLVSVIRTHEKMAWLLRSNIALEQFDNQS